MQGQQLAVRVVGCVAVAAAAAATATMDSRMAMMKHLSQTQTQLFIGLPTVGITDETTDIQLMQGRPF